MRLEIWVFTTEFHSPGHKKHMCTVREPANVVVQAQFFHVQTRCSPFNFNLAIGSMVHMSGQIIIFHQPGNT